MIDNDAHTLPQVAKEFWKQFVASSDQPLAELPTVIASYAGNTTTTDSLIERYLTGKQTAGSGLKQEYIATHWPCPKLGDYWIVMDSKDVPRVIVKTIRIETHKFSEVPLHVAIAEGDGDQSIWSRGHREYFTPYLSEWNVPCLDEADVITEFFEIVFPKIGSTERTRLFGEGQGGALDLAECGTREGPLRGLRTTGALAAKSANSC